LGAPKNVNLGTHDPIVLWSTSGTRHRIWVGHPQYFCPARIHVDWWSTMYVECTYQHVTYWFKTWGNHDMLHWCARIWPRGTIRYLEQHQ
jgi:hypothetical protein